MELFFSPFGCLKVAARVSIYPFIFKPKLSLAKIKFNLESPRFEPTTMPIPN